ncbi:uncharacterized protein LOC134291151 isoform X2 [Aedes albopictus]
MAVCWSEDATRISGGVEYNSILDQLTGLVAPMDDNGMPKMDLFNCSSPLKIVNDLKQYPIARYVQLCMVQPLARHASPFCVNFYCTNNKFTTQDVLKRWQFVEQEFTKEGIQIVAKSTDGDSRFIGGMMEQMKLPPETDSESRPDNAYGDWYIATVKDSKICVQDTTHLVNKFRTRLMKTDQQLQIGTMRISNQHLMELIQCVSKDQHGLTITDLNENDKMKFRPVEKITKDSVIELLRQHVPLSGGTVQFLTMMSEIMSSYMSSDMAPLQRVYNIWKVLLIVRAWRNWCYAKHGNLQKCITTNAYWGLEINAHALISYIDLCRRENIQFLVDHLHSQTCEAAFRDTRSLTSTASTVVNFTIQGFESRLNRIQMKRDIMARQQASLNFPRSKSESVDESPTVLPNEDDISRTVEEAMRAASEILIGLGVEESNLSFEHTIRRKCQLPGENSTFQYVDVPDEHVHENPESLYSDKCPSFQFVDVPEIAEDDEDNVVEASEVFANVGRELHLKDAVSYKNTFKIRNRNGRIVSVKKRTFLWMLTSDLVKCSTDRVHRFKDGDVISKSGQPRSLNGVCENVSLGEFLLVRSNGQINVVKVYGFKFLKGKNQSCSLTTVPLVAPSGVNPRGIGIIGNFFDLVEYGNDIVLELSNVEQVDIEYYLSHLKKPSIESMILYYSSDTAEYIQSLK